MAQSKTKTKKSNRTQSKTKRTSQTKTRSVNTTKTEPVISPAVRNRLLAVALIFLLVVAFFQLGIVGHVMHVILNFFIGTTLFRVICILLLLYLSYMLFQGKPLSLSSPLGVGLILCVLSGLAMCWYAKDVKGLSTIGNFFVNRDFTHGGLIGVLIYGLLSTLFDSLGALIALIIVMILGAGLLLSRLVIYYRNSDLDFSKDVEKIKTISNKPKKHQKSKKQKTDTVLLRDDLFEDTAKEDSSDLLVFNKDSMQLEIEEQKPIPKEPKVVKTLKGPYHLPSYELLNPIETDDNSSEENRNAKRTAEVLVNLLAEFGINVHVEDYHVGPTVTKYELKLEIGTRVNKIVNLQNDIQLALAAKEIRIEAPIPGKPYVGIEVPNKAPVMVSYNEVFQMALRDHTWSNKLAVPLGIDVSGKLIVCELNNMPHLLIAGTTGSGKSVCVNGIITSLLMKATPEEVRLILVDPKKVELSHYNGVPHLLAPVVTDPKKAAGVLQEVVAEMERRYEVFAASNVRNITTYNKYAKDYNLQHDEMDQKEIMPYHVIILDEVADLMMVASKTVEDCIMRIAQMARAAGIHMIVATQRPSTDIITGVIKANIPSRIAFAVSSSVDSRTILDASGAEKLLGKGDMLFNPMGASSPVRVQGAFVDDDEVKRVVEFVSNQQDAEYEDKYVNAKAPTTNGGSNSGASDDERDEEYENCREFVIREQKASTSLLQRHFRIGYNKAARIIEQLEADGVIGPQIGAKPREVYIKPFNEDDDF
ncbi:MAG: DUF87 domain-containing protein [Erysipelotrichaceae bacterium]|nr:DUF87 domain-containing protein [Erysipelotrichaceae bacterium]